jgi:hypothetical protein
MGKDTEKGCVFKTLAWRSRDDIRSVQKRLGGPLHAKSLKLVDCMVFLHKKSNV